MPAVPKVSGLNCPNCGAAIELRSFTNATSVVCQSCLSVLDARDPNLQVLQQAKSRQRVEPEIPLGTRGNFASGTFEVIGFQERTTYEDGVAYCWSEYLLFNPYKGFRYLTVYRGHWNFVQTLNTLPSSAGDRVVQVGETKFKIYSNSFAETTFVLGEFPWMVKVGEQVQVTDYIAPPKVLSAETTPEEIVWSIGDYMTGEEVWKAFQLTTPVPRAYGVFENQPSPGNGKIASIWKTALILTAAAWLVAAALHFSSGKKVILNRTFTTGDAVTASFDVPGHKSSLKLATLNLTGQPVYVQYSLVQQGGSRIVKFGRQVAPGGGADIASIPSVSPGHYLLSADADSSLAGAGTQYEIQVYRDAPSFAWVAFATVFLLIPPAFQSIGSSGFERSRWEGSNV